MKNALTNPGIKERQAAYPGLAIWRLRSLAETLVYAFAFRFHIKLTSENRPHHQTKNHNMLEIKGMKI